MKRSRLPVVFTDSTFASVKIWMPSSAALLEFRRDVFVSTA